MEVPLYQMGVGKIVSIVSMIKTNRSTKSFRSGGTTLGLLMT